MKMTKPAALIIALLFAGCATTPIVAPVEQEPKLVKIEVRTLEIDNSALPSMIEDEAFSCERISDLVKKAKAVTTGIFAITAQSGHESTIKGVTEWIYPTDFSVVPDDGKEKPKEEKKITAGQIVGGVVEPSGFETREIGGIVQVLTEVSKSGTILLAMSPQFVSDPEMKDYGPDLNKDKDSVKGKMEQPIFSTVSMSTSVRLKSGETVIAAACPDRRKKDKTFIIVVSARILK